MRIRARLLTAALGAGLIAGPLAAVTHPVAAAACTKQAAGAYPNDPGYAAAENGFPATQQTWDGENWYLYGCIPQQVQLTSQDPEGAAGLAIDQAWQQYGKGRDEVLTAYMEGGVNWRISSSCELRQRSYLNRGELPYPEDASGRTRADLGMAGDPFDLNGDGHFNVDDYRDDPRVPAGVATAPRSPSGGPYLHHVCSVAVPGDSDITPEDLIVAFGHCQVSRGQLGPCPAGGKFDNDGNGYPNDISGWNFHRDTNDPQTDQSVYGHFNGESARMIGQGNNGFQEIGLCPQCTYMPIKMGDEAIDRADRVAEAIVFAADSGVKVADVTTAGLGATREVIAAIEYAYHKGMVMAWASNDFESADHTDGMFYPTVWPGNSITGDHSTRGGAQCPGPFCAWVLSNTTFRARSSLTSYGPHALFSVPNTDGSTSAGTPVQAGVAALVMTEGYNAVDGGLIGHPLTADETKQVVRATSSYIGTLPTCPTCFQGVDGATFNIQYGYGRPNVLKAMKAVHDGQIPPTAEVLSPDWYTEVDPTRQSAVRVSAAVAAERAPGHSYSYQLQYAMGPQPLESDFKVFASGTGSGPQTVSGNIDLSAIPQAFWAGQYATTADRLSIERYDLTVRVQVRAGGLMGEDRRAIHVRHDDTEAAGYPVAIHSSGESSPTMADIEGRGYLDTIVATGEGSVHALRPDGTEAPGFPVRTGLAKGMDPTYPSNYLRGAGWRDGNLPRSHDPVLSATAVGDLRHDGGLEIVASTLSGYTYVWDGAGRLLSGFPVLNGRPEYFGMSVPPPDTPYSFNPENITGGAPVLVDLEGGGRLDIVQAAGDDHVYAWRPDGAAVPGWPVSTVFAAPASPLGPLIHAHDTKVVPTPAVANIDGDGTPDIVVGLVDTTWPVNNAGGGPVTAYVEAFDGHGTLATPTGMLAGWPVALQGALQGYGVAQDFVTQGTESPAVYDSAQGPQVVANPNLLLPQRIDARTHQVSAVFAPGVLPPSGSGLGPGGAMVQFTTSATIGNVLGLPLPQVFQPGSVGSDIVLGITQTPGIGDRVESGISGWDPSTGAVLPHYTQPLQGLPFFGAPSIADVTGDGVPDIIQPTDSAAIHGFDGHTGQPAPGFPKWSGGFSFWAPAVGDVFADGRVEVAAATREGYVHLWKTPGLASADNQAWHWHQDDRNSGHYGTDTRPPAGIRDLSTVIGATDTLTFTAPGDDWNSGTAAKYEVFAADFPIDQSNFGRATRLSATVPAPRVAGTKETIAIPHLPGVSHYAVRAVDAAGNIGPLPVSQSAGDLTPPPVTPLPATSAGRMVLPGAALALLTLLLLGRRIRRTEVRPAS